MSLEGPRGAPILKVELPTAAEAADTAREFVESNYRGRLPDPAIGNVNVVVSELVANAAAHGVGKIVLKTHWSGSIFRVEVEDAGSGDAANIREQGHDYDPGVGMQVVDRVALRWGAYEGSTHVWAEIATS